MNRFLKVAALSCVLVAVLPVLFLRSWRTEAASGSSCGKWEIVGNEGTPYNSYFYHVAADSVNDAWVAGYDFEHWNGIGWSSVSGPPGGANGLAAISKKDVWAVGGGISHWNGTTWSIVKSPTVGSHDDLNAVAAVSTSDVWAVGDYLNTSNVFQTLIEHWNGTTWSIIPSPFHKWGSFTGVTALSAKNAWAVGRSDRYSGLIEHWDGTSWSIVSGPSVGEGATMLGIAAASAKNIWAVGYIGYWNGPLIEHWNGMNWGIVSSPSPGFGNGDGLAGIARVPGTDQFWAVGGYTANSIGDTDGLTEFC